MACRGHVDLRSDEGHLRQEEGTARIWKCRLNQRHGEWGSRGQGAEKRGGRPWAAGVYESEGGPVSITPGSSLHSQLPNLPEQETGLVSLSLLKGGFMSLLKCLILCFQYLHHTTHLCFLAGRSRASHQGGLGNCLMLPGGSSARKRGQQMPPERLLGLNWTWHRPHIAAPQSLRKQLSTFWADCSPPIFSSYSWSIAPISPSLFAPAVLLYSQNKTLPKHTGCLPAGCRNTRTPSCSSG